MALTDFCMGRKIVQANENSSLFSGGEEERSPDYIKIAIPCGRKIKDGCEHCAIHMTQLRKRDELQCGIVGHAFPTEDYNGREIEWAALVDFAPSSLLGGLSPEDAAQTDPDDYWPVRFTKTGKPRLEHNYEDWYVYEGYSDDSDDDSDDDDDDDDDNDEDEWEDEDSDNDEDEWEDEDSDNDEDEDEDSDNEDDDNDEDE